MLESGSHLVSDRRLRPNSGIHSRNAGSGIAVLAMSCKELAQVLEEEFNGLSRLTELQIFDRSWDIALKRDSVTGG